MSLAAGGRVRGLLLAAPLLTVLPLSPLTSAQAARAPSGPHSEVSPAAHDAPAGLLPRPLLAAAVEGDGRKTLPGKLPGKTAGKSPGSSGALPGERKSARPFSRKAKSITAGVALPGEGDRRETGTPPGPGAPPAGAPPDAGGPPAARVKAPDDASRAPARESATGEEAIQAVPFLVGSGLILLAVVLVFRRTLRTDRLLERARRSRPPRPAGPRGRTGAAHDAERPSHDTVPPPEPHAPRPTAHG